MACDGKTDCEQNLDNLLINLIVMMNSLVYLYHTTLKYYWIRVVPGSKNFGGLLDIQYF